MSLMDWFKPASGGSWREKATDLSTRLADTDSAIERLRKEASSLVLSAGLSGSAAERRLAEIESEVGTLIARQGWQQQALAEAEAKAAAEEAAAAAERERQERAAKARRLAELRASYERAIAAGERKTAEAGEAWTEAGRIGAELAAAIGTDQARRALHPHALADRLTVTLWSQVKAWLHYDVNTRSPDAKLSPGEKERAIVAGLLGAAVQADEPEAA